MSRKDLTFRIFISSTFADFKKERDALQKTVFPQLSKYCKSRGARFQAIDLRWGISEAAARDYKTMDICFQELYRCQQLSPRPNFIFLLGNRYGWHPLPARIEADEFENILNTLSFKKQEFLKEWYCCDKNAVPEEYCLVLNKGQNNNKLWEKIEREIQSIFVKATEKIFVKNDPALIKYTASATHQEIEHGVLSAEKPQDHVFGYFRNISNLPVKSKNCYYRDFVETGMADLNAEKKLNLLKEQLRDILPQKHIHDYNSSWKKGTISNDHIAILCEDVYKDLKSVIEQEINSYHSQSIYLIEQVEHKKYAEGYTRIFEGRNVILEQIEQYCKSEDDRPLIFYGPVGCGKTALLAKAWLNQSSKLNSIARFIGATPRSTNIQNLLTDLSMEISQDDASVEKYELIKRFIDVIYKAGQKDRMILFIDGLDQLQPLFNAQTLFWFPWYLPKNVKLIASISIDANGDNETFKVIQKHLTNENIVEVRPLDIEKAEIVFKKMLSNMDRKLQPTQFKIVMEGFEKCRNLLYLKLASTEASRWKSWEIIEKDDFPTSVEGLIHSIITHLEDPLIHGKILVYYVLCYFVLSRYGLTEDEIMDILNDTKEVMDEFNRQKSPDSPDVEKLPMIIWSRLYNDIQSFLFLYKLDNINIISFYSQIFKKIIEDKYKITSVERQNLFLKLINFHKKNTIETRQVDELPWLIYSLKDWKQLHQTLSNVHLIEILYQRHGPELFEYWSKLKKDSEINIWATYSDKWEPALLSGCIPWGLSTLLGSTGDAEHSEIITDAIINYLRSFPEQEVDLAKALGGKSQFLMARNNIPAAQNVLKEALSIYRKNKRPLSIAVCLSDLAGCEVRKDPVNAMTFLDEAEKINRRLFCITGLISILGNKANILKIQNQYQQAIDLEEEAIQLALEIKQTIVAAEHQSGLASIFIKMNKLQKALELLKDAERVFRFYQLNGPLAACLGKQATIYAMNGDGQNAFEINEEAADLLRNSGQEIWLAECLLSQASLCLRLGYRYYSTGEETAIEVIQLLEKINAPVQMKQAGRDLLFKLRNRQNRHTGNNSNNPTQALDDLLRDFGGID